MKTKNRRNSNRRLFSESLEPRAMMAADVAHNFLYPHDVDDDGSVTPLDALVVINRLNRGSDDSASAERKFHDVDDDSQVTPLDALILINDINFKSTAPVGNGLRESSVMNASSARVRVELETEGPETELNIRMDNAPASSSFEVLLNDIALGQLVTDARGRGKLVLSQGDDNREHLPLPDGLTKLSPDMELVIGDIVKGKLSQVTKVESNGASTSTSVGSQEQHFAAKFDVVGGVVRSAEYEQETEGSTTKRKFKAEIEKATPNAKFDVTVGGILVGSVQTDSKGKGRLSLTTNPKDAGDQIMPSTFPAISDGTITKIGTVESTMRRTV